MLGIDFQILSSFVQLAGSMATIVIAFLVYKVTVDVARINYIRNLNDQWQQINMFLISDKEAWLTVQHFFRSDNEIDESKFKKQQLVPMLLNVGQGYYVAMKRGYVEASFAESYLNNIAKGFSHDAEYAVLAIDYGYAGEYGNYMKEKIREFTSRV